jgi:RND family efflux transporter MFP subunit
MLPIASRGIAKLLELRSDEGDFVEQGQVLAKLESRELRSIVETLRAREQFAKKEFDRNAYLLSKKATSEQAYDRAKSEWEAALSTSAEAEARMQDMDLLAPAAGRVIRRDGEIGQMIPANQPVFWIAVDSPLRLSAEVDEEDIARVKEGQSVVLRADAFPDKTFTGVVKNITPKGDPIARSYRVRIELSPDSPLQIGMTAEANIVVAERQDAILVPTSAVQQGHVWVVRDSRARRVPVVVGVRGTKQTEILSGISTADRVVVLGDVMLDEGQRVYAEATGPGTP